MSIPTLEAFPEPGSEREPATPDVQQELAALSLQYELSVADPDDDFRVYGKRAPFRYNSQPPMEVGPMDEDSIRAAREAYVAAYISTFGIMIREPGKVLGDDIVHLLYEGSTTPPEGSQPLTKQDVIDLVQMAYQERPDTKR